MDPDSRAFTDMENKKEGKEKEKMRGTVQASPDAKDKGQNPMVNIEGLYRTQTHFAGQNVMERIKIKIANEQAEQAAKEEQRQKDGYVEMDGYKEVKARPELQMIPVDQLDPLGKNPTNKEVSFTENSI